MSPNVVNFPSSSAPTNRAQRRRAARRQKETEIARLYRIASHTPDRTLRDKYLETFDELVVACTEYSYCLVMLESSAEAQDVTTDRMSEALSRVRAYLHEMRPFFEAVRTSLPVNAPAQFALDVFTQCFRTAAK